MTSWIGNCAVLKSSSKWQLKEFGKKIIHAGIIQFSKYF